MNNYRTAWHNLVQPIISGGSNLQLPSIGPHRGPGVRTAQLRKYGVSSMTCAKLQGFIVNIIQPPWGRIGGL